MINQGVPRCLTFALQGSALKLPDCARHFLTLRENYFLVIRFEADLARHSFQLLEPLLPPCNFRLDAPSVLPEAGTALRSKSWK